MVGDALVGVPVSLMSGDDIAPQIARLKGNQEAIIMSMRAKGCWEFRHGLEARGIVLAGWKYSTLTDITTPFHWYRLSVASSVSSAGAESGQQLPDREQSLHG